MSKMNDEVQAIPLVDLVEDTDNFHTKKPSSIDSKSLCFIFLGSTFMTLLIALIVSLSSNAYDIRSYSAILLLSDFGPGSRLQ